MKKKLAIFPVDYQTVSFARNAYLNQYEAVALLSPALQTLVNSDISVLDGGEKTDILLKLDYRQEMMKCDIVYFADSRFKNDAVLCKDLIDYANNQGKEVVISRAIEKYLSSYRKIPLSKGAFVATELLPIDTPIISSFTINDNCGQFHTEMQLRKYFMDKGYAVSQIATHDYATLLGCSKLPSFLFETTSTDQEKIIRMNRFIFELCEKEKPDVLILGVPTPIMKYNNRILNGLGVLPFIIQNAVTSDLGILNLDCKKYTLTFIEYMSEFCKFNFGVATEYFSISNVCISVDADMQKNLEYLYIDTAFVNQSIEAVIEDEKYTVYSTFDNIEAEKAFRKMEGELKDNVHQL